MFIKMVNKFNHKERILKSNTHKIKSWKTLKKIVAVEEENCIKTVE